MAALPYSTLSIVYLYLAGCALQKFCFYYANNWYAGYETGLNCFNPFFLEIIVPDMWSIFKKKSGKKNEMPLVEADFSFLGTDMHSHLIPGIDDGSPDIETSIELIRRLRDRGYRKIITSPHVHQEFYPENTKERILAGLETVRKAVADLHLNVEVNVAAEYFLDNSFMMQVLPKGLLTFGNNYVLVEVSMAGWPRQFDNMIFEIQSAGYTPVLAHPERYVYEHNADTFLELKGRGILMQMNLLAPAGYYGRTIKGIAEKYLDAGLYDLFGTDCHHHRHAERLAMMPADTMQLLQEYPHPLLNKTL